MRNFFQKINIGHVVLLGFFLRVIFALFFAHVYYGKIDFYVGGDTKVHSYPIQHLIQDGMFSIEKNDVNTSTARLPGYPFFLGIFYLASNQHWDLAYRLAFIFQILLDTFCVLLFFRIVNHFLENKRTALWAAFLYALYPFVIVWTALIYAESISISFLIVGIYFLTRTQKKYLLLSGMSFCVSFFCRPQIAIAVCFIGLYFFIFNFRQSDFKIAFQKIFLLALGFLLIYSPWPIRNYVVTNGKIVLVQQGDSKWFDKDIIAFREFVYSVKSDWEPQFSEILKNKKVEWPHEAYNTSSQDSMLLERVTYLSKNCGSGFSCFDGYWKNEVTTDKCNDSIATIFKYLLQRQKIVHARNYYWNVPLQNLEKCFFKSVLNKQTGIVKKISMLLFLYRTFLLLLGFIGVIIAIFSKAKGNFFLLMIMMHLLTLYLLFSFGTGQLFRNIEMRYLLPADVLMLIPAAFLIHFLMEIFLSKEQC